MMTKTDRILFWGTLLLAACLLFVSNGFFLAEGETIVVELEGREYARYDKDALKESQTFTVKTKKGYNQIEVSKQGASIIDADCGDKQCLGEISKSGEFLICLPHKLIVRMEGKREADGVAY